MTTDPIGEQLAGWGKVARLETRGRRSGRPQVATVGYVEESDGSLLVAAGDPGADWVRNLRADPTCRATVGERTAPGRAEELDGPDRARAIRELILRYGTPAERLGAGPAFRIRPLDPAAKDR